MVFTVPWYVDRRDGKIIKKKHIKHRTVGLIEYWNRMMGSTLTFFWAVYTAKASRSRPYPMRMKIWIPVFRTDRRYSPGVRPHLVGVIASGSQAPSLLHQVPMMEPMDGGSSRFEQNAENNFNGLRTHRSNNFHGINVFGMDRISREEELSIYTTDHARSCLNP